MLFEMLIQVDLADLWDGLSKGEMLALLLPSLWKGPNSWNQSF